MRLYVTGSRGQLGWALHRAAVDGGHEFTGCDLPELDITDAEAVYASVTAAKPDVLINCAAFTAVDKAEKQEAVAMAVNGAAVTNVARAADAAGAMLVQISTDYVFDGASDRPYREPDRPNPLSAYGRTKLAGERAAELVRRHLVVRTAWLFGEGANFVTAIRRQLDAGQKTIRVVADQRGCPTFATDLARAILRLVAGGTMGVVHVVNAGDATWCEFAFEIAHQLDADVEIIPITTAEAARPARRPAYSVLDTAYFGKLTGGSLPAWQDALARHLARHLAP